MNEPLVIPLILPPGKLGYTTMSIPDVLTIVTCLPSIGGFGK